MSSIYFAPRCALMLYKPYLAQKIHRMLESILGEIIILDTCCHFDPGFKESSEIINICPGCDKRFTNNYERVSTRSLWEILDDSTDISYPDAWHQQLNKYIENHNKFV
jgi:hypothetical protein